MWQCCECQQVVDARLVVQRWRKHCVSYAYLGDEIEKNRLYMHCKGNVRRSITLADFVCQ